MPPEVGRSYEVASDPGNHIGSTPEVFPTVAASTLDTRRPTQNPCWQTKGPSFVMCQICLFGRQFPSYLKYWRLPSLVCPCCWMRCSWLFLKPSCVDSACAYPQSSWLWNSQLQRAGITEPACFLIPVFIICNDPPSSWYLAYLINNCKPNCRETPGLCG